MPNFYHNIFYFYRGAKLKDAEFEKQLEDNTTKALINTLENCDSSVVHEFLKWFNIDAQGKISYELQRHTIGAEKLRRKSKKILLGLVPEKNKEYSNWILNKSVVGTSRPDAWIHGENFVILIESKIVGSLDVMQMRRHFQKLKTGLHRNPKFTVRSWAEIHQFFMNISTKVTGKNRWIINQFLKYLEYIGMSDFVGFNDEIFDYFIKHDDEDTRKWVRSTFHSFAKLILAELNKLDPFFESLDLGVIHTKDTAAWVAFGLGNQKYRNWAHLTIAINSQGLEILVNVELKSASDRLKKKLKNDYKKFRGIINKIPSDDLLWIQLEERKKRQVVIYDYNLITKIQLKSLKDKNLTNYGFDYIESLIKEIPLPYFSLRKQIPRNEVLKSSQKDQGKTLIEDVLNIAKELHPIVNFINS